MYMIKKSLAAVLALLLCVGVLAMPAYAAEVVQDGLEVSLTTDKDVYGQGETVVATLKVTNGNDAAVHDVSLESLVPEGYAPADGDETVLRLDTLGAGETVTLTVSFIAKDTNIPPTGDDSALGLWLVLLVVSVAGLAVLAIKYKPWKRVLSLVLCAVMLVSLFAGVPAPAKAEQSDAKTIDIATTVKAADKQIEVKATVKYTMAEKEAPAVHTVRFDLVYSGAPQIDAQQVAHGKCAVQPEGIAREGWTFAFWYTQQENGIQKFDLSQPVTQDLTLYAYWVEEGSDANVNYTTFYDVSFAYPDGLTQEQKNGIFFPEDQLVSDGSLVYALPEPYSEEYVFGGWYYDSALTKAADPEDTIQGNTVLYPLMLKSDASTEGTPTNNYVADLDVTDLDHAVTVKAPSRQAVLDGIVFLDISAGGTEMDFDVTDNGDGTYTVRARDGLEGGNTYQLRAMDRDQLPSTEQMTDISSSYIRFIHNGETQSTDVRYYNIFTVREEVDNLRLANGIIFIPSDQVEGIDMEQASALYSVNTDEEGQMNIDTNELEGSFRYTGTKTLSAGDVVAIYTGDAAVEEEYLTGKTAGSAESTAFLEILSASGSTYTYRTAQLEDVLFVPDVLPIPLGADTDGDLTDGSATVDDSYLDFRYFPVESTILDADTVAEAGDFVAFYTGTLEEPGDITYGRITSVERNNGSTTITFGTATLDDINTALDSFVYNEVPVELSESEQTSLENQIVQQGIDSGFAEKAAAFALREKLAMEETPVWGKSYTLSHMQAQLLDVDIESGEIDAGTFIYQVRFDPPDVNATVTKNLKKITTINGGKGLRVAFGVYVPIGLEVVNILTNEVDESLKVDLYVTFEQEFAFDIHAKVDADVELLAGFIPTDAYVQLSTTFDIGTYTGVGAVVMVDTEKNYEKSYLWNELVEQDGSNGAFTSAVSLTEQLNSMLADGNTSFFDQYKDENGNSTLIAEYQKMLSEDVDYIDILAVPLSRFKGYITPNVPVAQYVIEPELVFGAKVNVALGTSFESLNVKQFGFGLRVSLTDGVSAWANPVVDKQTPYHSFNLMMLGNMGLRAGIRLTASIGLLSVKLANVGMMIELGMYVDLYGFGFYHYDWTAEPEAGRKQTNIQSAGAFYMEIGFYMDLDLFAGALMDMFTIDIHLLELEVPIWELGTRKYIYDVELTRKEYSGGDYFHLPDYMYRVKAFNVVTGEITSYNVDSSQFAVVIPEAYQDKIRVSESANGNHSHFFYFVHDRSEVELEVKAQIVLAASIDRTRSAKLDSLYDIIGPAQDTLTVKWSRDKEYYDICYNYKAPEYSYGGTGVSSHYPKATRKVVSVLEGDSIPKLSSINAKAPALEGFDFSGWKVSCYRDETLDGMYIESISDLAGYSMPLADIILYPVYAPRSDTKFTVRHLIPSLTDPDEYEVFMEEVHYGTTNTVAGRKLEYYTQHDGISPDYDRLPIYQAYYGDNGEWIYVTFGVMIRNDGSTVLDLYYKRDMCWVTLHANNPDYIYCGDQPDTYSTQVQFGDAVKDPGYGQTQIPGYTFLGWSTAADGSSGILETLPDALSFTNQEQRKGLSYYAIWAPEKVQLQINYHLLDPYGEYRLQGSEQRELDCGTKLTFSALAPQALQLPEMAYGSRIEAVLETESGTQNYARDHIYAADGTLQIHVYYTLKYSRVCIGTEYSYYGYGDTVTLPAAEKLGYRFLGWKSVYESGAPMYQPGQTATVDQSDYCFVPVFAAADGVKYTVEHYLEQLDGTYSEEPTETQVLYGTTDSRVSPEVNAYAGFNSPNVTSAVIAADGSTVVTYYYTRKTYTVRVDHTVEGEDLILRGKHTASYKYGVGFALMDPYDSPLTIAREGYTIVGWYLVDETLNPDQTLLDPNTYQVSGDALTSEKELVFKPKWEKVPCEYKVEHYLEQLDGTYVLQQTDKLTATIHDTVTAQTVQFTGFTVDPSVDGTVQSGTITTVSETLVLKLYYTRNSYTATWLDYDGITGLGTAQFRYGETVVLPSGMTAPSREGYIFDGWKDFGTMPASNVSFCAADHGNWTANIGPYELVFDFNGESMKRVSDTNEITTYETADVTKTVNAGAALADYISAAEVNDFVSQSYPGYTFAGWYDAVGNQYDATTTAVMPSGNLTLTAKWTPIQITVTFYSGYSYGYAPNVTGTTVTKTYSYGDSIEIPENDFAWDGHIITGWKFGDGLGGFGQYPDIVELPIVLVYDYYSSFYEGDALELFPYWTSEQNVLTVEFNGNGAESGTMDDYLLNGASGASLPKNKFSRAGYTFAGWNTAADGTGAISFINGDWISNEQVEAEKITLYAQWEPIG